MSRGFQGLVLKALGANDYRLTVTDVTDIGPHYRRIGFDAGGLLDHHPYHATQWIRMWIPNGDKLQQRGYTLVDPRPDENRFDVEFALHDTPASEWARAAATGDVIDATVMGSKFAMPSPAPSEYVVFGDTASLPAINSLLDEADSVPARIWLEWQYPDDRALPVHANDASTVTWVQRIDDGRLMREAADAITPDDDAYGWVACDMRTTRHIAKRLRSTLAKNAVKSQAYWT
ncbi:siderophore-interacting protein [Williamsia sterculiae]|nr:siderophore-interacting protein [Williamsia sterculiae]